MCNDEMPTDDGIPSVKISETHESENLEPLQTQRLSRSPHPYHRRQIECAGHLQWNGGEINLPNLKTLESTDGGFEKLTVTREKTQRRVKRPTSPSDSGTEADDESGFVLQSLPAPPLRWHKGLKGQDGEGSASPLLTPSYLDDERQGLELERQLSRHADYQSSASVNDGKRIIREKFTRRRRAELLRRLSETVLLGIVGYIAFIRQADLIIGVWRPEMIAYASVLIGTYILYPISLFYRHSILPSHERCSHPLFRIPAAFDPATLLYPVLIPVFVTCLLIPSNETILLPNLILSISSIPRAILPIHDWSLGQSSFHWALSSLPLALSSGVCHTPQKNDMECVATLPDSFGAEYAVLLYPLHKALLPTLGYLTTTSLLPAELQLLSISMINLLLFSRSPQSVILQALLWIGGLATFVSCGYVLRWGVALARIPTWRFRHPRLRSRDAYVLLSAIDDCFHRRLSKWMSALIESESQDRGQELNNIGIATAASEGLTDESRFRTANDAPNDSLPNHNLDTNGLSRDQTSLQRSQRRHTLPASSTNPLPDLIYEDSKQHPRRRSARRKHGQFNYLTHAQARVLKWIFAGYIYSVVLIIIAFPVRTYISQQALNGNDPVGWAAGYLLGNVPIFRQSVLHWTLDDWVALPEPHNGLGCSTWMSNLSDCVRGSANTRLLICLYCLCVIAIGIATVLRLSESVEVDTRRKVFHGMMVVMFLPSIFIDPPFVALAFVLTLAIFILLDLFRASQLPPLSAPLTMFLAPYVDGRDYRGPVVVSHMFLLIGCAIPLWLSLAGTDMIGEAPWEGWDVASRDLGMISGIVCVGMGDAAASLIGRRYGRRRWCWSGGKSLEGSLAFSMAVVLGLSLGRTWLLLGGWDGDSGDPWSLTLGKASLAAAGASLTEAVLTGGNDNVVVPVILWLLVRGLKI